MSKQIHSIRYRIKQKYRMLQKLEPQNDLRKDIVMYIFVNSDLKMREGKSSGQVGHIVGQIVEEIVRAGYEESPIPNYYFDFMKWRIECTKIILRATYDQLLELSKMENARQFFDTVPGFAGIQLTTVGFFPSSNSKLAEIAKSYKLL
jgi:peptidyl-tRNA hydrolase